MIFRFQAEKKKKKKKKKKFHGVVEKVRDKGIIF